MRTILNAGTNDLFANRVFCHRYSKLRRTIVRNVIFNGEYSREDSAAGRRIRDLASLVMPSFCMIRSDTVFSSIHYAEILSISSSRNPKSTIRFAPSLANPWPPGPFGQTSPRREFGRRWRRFCLHVLVSSFSCNPLFGRFARVYGLFMDKPLKTKFSTNYFQWS